MWETLDVKSLGEATTLRLRRQLELDGGWRPTTKVKEPTALMLDKAKDDYLAQIEKGKKPNTYKAYNTSLKYFYECLGNKALKDITRADMLNFAAFLGDEKRSGSALVLQQVREHHDVPRQASKYLRPECSF